MGAHNVSYTAYKTVAFSIIIFLTTTKLLKDKY